jgi:hypothetical protein
MTAKEILIKFLLKVGMTVNADYVSEIPEEEIDFYMYIFDHSFAKTFWGKEFIQPYEHGEKNPLIQYATPAWQYHLQQMVLEENPIKYLEKFL